MKKTNTLFIAILFSGICSAQVSMSNINRHDLAYIGKCYRNKTSDFLAYAALKDRFAVNVFNQEECLALIAKVNPSFQKNKLEKAGIYFGSRINDIVTMRVPLSKLEQIDLLEGIEYLEIAPKVSPTLDKAIKDIRADSVQQGINLPQSYTGRNVYVGICDWGFDYTHPNFYDTLLQQTRIAAAWDQYKRSGPAPASFSYGTEYSTPQDLLNAHSDTANIYSYGFHASHVAGICGGSGAGTPYRGVAFDAQYLFATFLVDAAAVMDAYAWMYEKSQAAGKRLVINQSWGLHYIGNLDGTSLLSQCIDSYSLLGVVFVSSAGNNGNVNFHLKKTFSNNVLKTKIDFYDYSANPNMWGQSLSLWGEPTKEFSTKIQVLNGSNVLLVESPYYSTATTVNYVDSMLVSGTDTIFFNVSCENANPQNQRPHVRFRVKNTNTALKVVMNMTAVDGTVHCWNVTELSNGVGNWGMPFTGIGTGYSTGDVNYGISEPACTNSTIAVAAYATSYQIGSSWVGGAIASFSSYGPTLDERVKPDISAPGVNIASSFSSYTDAVFTPTTTVTFNGRVYPFDQISGTSMSGPMVTGVVALILEANPYLSPQQIKDIIKQTARFDNYTGVVPVGGSLRWGAGKLNAYAAIQLALLSVGTIENPDSKNNKLKLFPNPAGNELNLDLGADLSGTMLQLIEAGGKITELEVCDNVVSLSDLSSGAYLVRFEFEGKIYQQRIIKK